MRGRTQVEADRAGESEGPGALAFSDQHRQNYSQKVPPPGAGDFFVGAYTTEGTVGRLGELRIVLHELGDRSGRLDPQLCVFGDGAGALAALLADVGPDLAALLGPGRRPHRVLAAPPRARDGRPIGPAAGGPGRLSGGRDE